MVPIWCFLTVCWTVLSSFTTSFLTCHICQQPWKFSLFRNETSHCKSAFCKTEVFCVHGLHQPSRYKKKNTKALLFGVPYVTSLFSVLSRAVPEKRAVIWRRCCWTESHLFQRNYKNWGRDNRAVSSIGQTSPPGISQSSETSQRSVSGNIKLGRIFFLVFSW